MLESGMPNILSGEELYSRKVGNLDGHDAFSLAALTRAVVADRNLRSRWDRERGLSKALSDRASSVLTKAFEYDDIDALHDLHATLFTLNELHVAQAGTAQALNQYDFYLIDLRNKLERAWFHIEFVQYSRGMSERDAISVVDAVRQMWATSEAGTHTLFDFLEFEASDAQMVAFFQSDAALNTRFFDLLAFALIGSSNSARRELIQNMWDEAGRGDPQKGHVKLFESLLASVGVDTLPEARHLELGLHGLIGHNLFMSTCASREHYFKSLGVMAITELMDPAHYEKLVRGCKRLGLAGSGELEYYEEHVTIDVIHGEGWLNNVIAPAAIDHPSAADEILFGAYLRLKTCAAYYDEVQAKLARYK